jgi:hypothetical protein
MAWNLEERAPPAIGRALDLGRTSFWYTRLTLRTGKRTPYALGKYLQPDTYRENKDEIPFHHNLWTKYAHGEVVPSASLLEAVEAKVPGSRADFHHVLFVVLDPNLRIRGVGDELFRRMHPGVQRAVFDAASLKLGYYRRRAHLSRVLPLLGAQGHLDALAAAIVLLREAQDAGREEDVYRLGVAIHHALLIACATSPGISISWELMMLVSFLVLRPLNCSGRRFAGTLGDLNAQRNQLLHTLWHLEDHPQPFPNPTDEFLFSSKIVRGDYGDDLRWALMPRLAAVGELKDLSTAARLDVVRDEVFGGWARESLASYRFESFVPVAVATELCDRLDAFKDPELEAPKARRKPRPRAGVSNTDAPAASNAKTPVPSGCAAAPRRARIRQSPDVAHSPSDAD